LTFFSSHSGLVSEISAEGFACVSENTCEGSALRRLLLKLIPACYTVNDLKKMKIILTSDFWTDVTVSFCSDYNEFDARQINLHLRGGKMTSSAKTSMLIAPHVS
jgi:hypothetical protein